MTKTSNRSTSSSKELTTNDAVKAVEAVPHEFSANYLFTDYDLRPFFGADRAVKDNNGTVSAPFDACGESWTATLYYQESGICHPGDENPQGTEFRVDELREFRVAVEADDDATGQRSFNLHLAPRWQGMEVETSSGDRRELSVPDGIHEAVNVKVSGSNIPFHDYGELLRCAFSSVGIRGHYFDDAHPMSNVQDAEMYVRLHRDHSGPIHGREGPLAQLGHLLEDDRSGYRKLVQNDDDEAGRNLPGYYHTTTLGARRISSAFPGQELPKEIKHYYAREAASKDSESPLAHPKLGSSYQSNRWDSSLGVDDDALAQLEDELTETVLTIIAEAGVSLTPGVDDAPYVSDPYFPADTRDYPDDPTVDLALTDLKSQQENVVVKHLADGFTPVEWESLEYLVTDGGQVSPADIADETGRHVDSVRRALKRLPDVVEHEYGDVRLRSAHIAELIADAVSEARDAVRRVVDTGAKAVAAANRGRDDDTAALMAWCAKHGIDVDDSSDARMVIRMDFERCEPRLQEAYRLWQQSGRDTARFRAAQVQFHQGGKGTVWKYL